MDSDQKIEQAQSLSFSYLLISFSSALSILSLPDNLDILEMLRSSLSSSYLTKEVLGVGLL